MGYLERLTVNEEAKASLLYDEHIARYQLVASLVKNKTVLDIACGSGYGSAYLAQQGASRVLGIDIDQVTIGHNQAQYQSPTLEFKVGDAGRLDIPSESFDIITSFETIEHLKTIEAYLAELQRVIKANGLVFISTPNKDVFQQKNPWHIKEFTKDEFKTWLEKYFSYVKIIEQKNAVASVIKVNDQTEGNINFNDSKTKALYFIAVCSKEKVEVNLDNIISANMTAYQARENNLGWRLVNWAYRMINFKR